jgi:23S rRNA (adenine2030-N6)-methyltransferase
MERTDRSPGLEGSAYARLLARHCGGDAPTYPESPLIAMELLGDAAEFLFCDLDTESLRTIADDARVLGLASGRVRLVAGDGVSTLGRELAGLTEAAGTFLQVDPYHPLKPGADGETSLGLFSRAAERGVGCMLWYGFDSEGDRVALLGALRDGIARRVWFGEVSLPARDLSEMGFDPGVLGCGVVLCNAGE